MVVDAEGRVDGNRLLWPDTLGLDVGEEVFERLARLRHADQRDEAAEGRARRQPPPREVREPNAALVGLVHAGGVLDGREHFALKKDRLPLAAARSRAIGGEIVQLHVEQQQVVAGLVGHLHPFAARGAVQLDMQGRRQ